MSSNFVNLATDPKIRDDRRDISFYFPINNKIKSISHLKPKNADNLKLTLEGTYSITRPDQGAQFVEQLARFPELKSYSLVDGTAGLGGDLIYMGSLFKSVTAYEFNPVHSEAIQANCSEYDIDAKVNVGNFTELYQDAIGPNTVLWLDPPWGGPSEWNKPDLRLKFYGDPPKYVNDFIKQCFSECKIPICILKCPSKTYLADFKPSEYKLTEIPIKRLHSSVGGFGPRNPEMFKLVIIKPATFEKQHTSSGVKSTRSRSKPRTRSRSKPRSRSKLRNSKTKK